MERAIEPCLADDVIAALGNPTKGISSLVNSRGAREAADVTRAEIRQAIRFEVTPELLETAYQLSLDDFHTLNDRVKSARPCHDLMWIEWDENVRQEIMGAPYTHFSRIGYLVTPTNPRATKGSNLDIDDGHYFTGFYDIRDESQYDKFYGGERWDFNKGIWSNPMGFTLKTSEFSSLEINKIFDVYGYEEHLKSPQTNKSKKILENDSRTYDLLVTHFADIICWLGREWYLKTTGLVKNEPGWTKKEASRIMDEVLLNYDSDTIEIMRRLCGIQTRTMRWAVSEEKWQAGWDQDDEFMSGITKASTSAIDGDLRWLLTIFWMINYNWIVISEPRKATKGKIRHGKVRPLNTFHRLKLALPKEHIIIKANEIGYGTPKSQHDVRGHFRVLKNPHRRIWIRSHKRGDPSLGVIMKDYVLDKTKDNYKPDPYQTYDSVW